MAQLDVRAILLLYAKNKKIIKKEIFSAVLHTINCKRVKIQLAARLAPEWLTGT